MTARDQAAGAAAEALAHWDGADLHDPETLQIPAGAYRRGARDALDAIVPILAAEIRTVHRQVEGLPHRCLSCDDDWPCQSELIVRGWLNE